MWSTETSSVSVWERQILAFCSALFLFPPSRGPRFYSHCSAFIQRWKHSSNSRTTRFWWGCVATVRHLTCSMITPQVSAVSIASGCVFVPLWWQFSSFFHQQNSTVSLPLRDFRLQGWLSVAWPGPAGSTQGWATVCSVSSATWQPRAGRLETVPPKNTGSCRHLARSSRASRPRRTSSPPHTLPFPHFVLLQLFQ